MNEEQRAELQRLICDLLGTQSRLLWAKRMKNDVRRALELEKRNQIEKRIFSYVDELLENAHIIDETPGLVWRFSW